MIIILWVFAIVLLLVHRGMIICLQVHILSRSVHRTGNIFFGEIENGKMILNDLGRYTTDHWYHISDHYPFVVGDTFICMPNHIHGIIIIGERVGTQLVASDNNKNKRTYEDTSLPSSGIQPKSGSLGAIVRGFKIGITKYAKQYDIPFARQGRYHDSIIRDTSAYERIKHYIETNPERRKKDSFFVDL